MRTATDNVPIFPLSTVLFPEGMLSLRVFETRYLDMVSRCLKEDLPFGVCLITEGSEVGDVASCYQIGTLAKIINWGQSTDGVLEIDVLGCQRFQVLESEVSAQQLILSSIQIIDEGPVVEIPDELSNFRSMLRNALEKRQPDITLDEEQFNDASWVGYRLTEVLPIEEVIRQRLLEIDDPIERLQRVLGLFANR